MEFFDLIGEAWVQRALLASCMVGIMCGVLGSFIVLRNMALLGDAISHATLPGIVFAFVIFGYNTLGFFVGSLAAGMLTAVIITWIQQKVDTKNDAAIGITYTLMFAIGVAWISKVSHTDGVHLDLKDFLIGNMLGVSNQDLYLMFAVLIYVLISLVVFYRYFFAVTFEPIIAQTMGVSVKTIHYFLMLILSFVVVSSLKSVGLILVVAMLIIPASTALLISKRLPKVLAIAGLIGLFSAVLGLIFSIEFETTPGPMMVIIAAFCYFSAVLFAPQKGLVSKYFTARKSRYRILREDILKHGYRLSEKGTVTTANLANKIGQTVPFVEQGLNRLRRKGLLSVEKKEIVFSETGIAAANRLIRAHRLWETYLVNKLGMDAAQIHEDAERYEHLLTEEMLDKLEEKLGFPDLDPHGSPIPKKSL